MNRYPSLHLAAFVLTILVFGRAYAVDKNEKPTELPASCGAEIKSFCGTEESPGARAKCLFMNIGKLSQECKLELSRFARAAEQSGEQSGGSLISPSALSSQSPPFTILILDNRYTSGEDPAYEGRVSVSTPIRQTKESYFAASVSGSVVNFDRGYALNSQLSTPKTLKRAEVGLQYTKQLEGFRNWGLRGSVGYAGDDLFITAKDTAFNLIASYTRPSSSSSGFWMYSLFFSNNSPLGNYIPIPGVLYIYRTATFTGLFGLPTLSLQWTPSKHQAFSISLLGLNATAEAALGDIQRVQIFTAVRWATQSFILKDRADEDDRLNLEEKKAAVGARTFLLGRMQLEFESGLSFDRILFSGDGLRNMRAGSHKLDDNWFAGLSLKSGF